MIGTHKKELVTVYTIPETSIEERFIRTISIKVNTMLRIRESTGDKDAPALIERMN